MPANLGIGHGAEQRVLLRFPRKELLARLENMEGLAAQEDGYLALKFFPALQAGGAAMLKAWQGPFGDVRFCPTGGVTAANAGELLALSNVVCVGGSWLTPADAVAGGDWARITQLAREAARLPRKV